MTEAKRTAREMSPLVEACLASKLTQQEFRAEHDMSVAVRCYRLARYRRKSSEIEAFLDILTGAAASERPLLEECYPRGVRLRIVSPLKAAYIDHLLSSV